jgi:arsenic resistance protein ArsH
MPSPHPHRAYPSARARSSLRTGSSRSGPGRRRPASAYLLPYKSLRELFLLPAVRRGRRHACCASLARKRIFDSSTLPLPNQFADDDYPAVHELRDLSMRLGGGGRCGAAQSGTARLPVS